MTDRLPSGRLSDRLAAAGWSPSYEPLTVDLRDPEPECAECVRLRAELRRLQRLLIDAEVLTECDDLCMVLCAGPCQGENTEPLGVA